MARTNVHLDVQISTETNNTRSIELHSPKMGFSVKAAHPVPSKRLVRRRKMTEAEKLDYRTRRLLKACRKCASAKRKCNHRPIDASKTISSTNVADGSRANSESSSERPTRTNEEIFAECDDDSVWFEVVEEQAGPCRQYMAKPDEIFGNQVSPDATTLSLYQPRSPETLPATLFVENIRCHGVADRNSWFSQLPARIGHDACLDLAVAALQATCWYRRGLPGTFLAKVYKALAAALEALKINMSNDQMPSDHTLASVAALSPVEAIRTGHTFLVPTHLDGIIAMISSRAARGPLSELFRRILEYHLCDSYVLASIRGILSPFEGIDKMYCEPYERSYPAAERRIRAIGNELCIRLPRLTALVRATREQRPDAATVSVALDLAEQLVQLKDDAAESDYLRLLGIERSTLPTDIVVTKYSFQFKTISSLEAAAYYWHCQTALLRLCCRLRSYYPEMSDVYSLPSQQQSEAEQQRYCSNILMTAEYARSLTARKRQRLFAQSLITCWGAFRDSTAIFPLVKDPNDVRAWLLSNFNSATSGRLTEHDMDVAADLFVGGPLVGAYKDLYETGKLTS